MSDAVQAVQQESRLKTLIARGKEQGYLTYAVVNDRVGVDFSANINPLGPPAWLRSIINRDLSMVAHYPDPEYLDFRNTVGSVYDVGEESVIPSNGSSELLHLLPPILNTTSQMMRRFN